MYDFIVIGGGAAGFFAAINVAKNQPQWKIAILEKQSKVLQKVRIAGGGRCNVTNSISEPEELVTYYPRGGDFLKDPFKSFNPKHTRQWFLERGIKLKTEKDGRVFPITDSSQTIIDCFLDEAKNINILFKERVESFHRTDNFWEVNTHTGKQLKSRYFMVASGSDRRIWQSLKSLDLKINPEVPSLFTFNIKDEALHQLQGISFENAIVNIVGTNLKQDGPLLITHWGLSGPVILKLSAWGAYILKDLNYHFKISVNWLGHPDGKSLENHLKKIIAENPKKNIRSLQIFDLPHRFWTYICDKSNIGAYQKGAETGKKQIRLILENLISCPFEVTGKSTFKDEFVTAGGISLTEVDNTSFQSKKYKKLYFGGEVLDIDGLTGGFNFQAAWTAGFLIAESLKKAAK